MVGYLHRPASATVRPIDVPPPLCVVQGFFTTCVHAGLIAVTLADILVTAVQLRHRAG